MSFPGLAPRDNRLASLAGVKFDLLVIGGGITGAGVARDAASRRLSVAILERDDWGSGTSSRSSKLVHGGLRYLREGDVRLVFESLSERALLARLAPHLVRPIDFLFPAHQRRGVPVWQLEVGLTTYDLLSLGRAPHRHRRLSRSQILARERLLDSPELLSGALSADFRTDDARLTLENVLDAAALGAVAVSRVAVERLEKDASGRVQGVQANDRETGRLLSIAARKVVNATGPWGDGLRRLDRPDLPPLLRLSRGAHVTVSAQRLPLRHAVAFWTEDDRLMFAIPQGPVTLLGTTESEHSGSPDAVQASREDVAYIFSAAARTFPAARLGPGDVVATFAALRPLVREIGKNLQETSREQSIELSSSGMLTVTGGKLTTHRLMGARAVDAVIAGLAGSRGGFRSSQTRTRSFPGAPVVPFRDFSASFERASGEFGLPPDSARHLAARYGQRAEDVLELVSEQRTLRERLVPGLPDIAAEALFAARAEDARSVSDVMIRRTHLFWQAPRQGVDALVRVGAILSRELGWSRKEEDASREEYLREIDRSREALR
jgi:glycerol-3-phosphate dehydrogenase